MSHMDTRSGPYRYVYSEGCERMPFSVWLAGVDRCGFDYHVKRECAGYSVAGVTLKGAGIVKQNGKCARAEAGSLFLVTQTEDFEYYPETDWEFCWVNIHGEFWKEVLTRYGLKDQVLFPDFTLAQEFQELVREAVRNGVDLNAWQIRIQAFLYKMALHLYGAQSFREEQTLAARIKAEFDRNLSHSAPQEAVCRKIGITARHAQRIFRQEYGFSIHQYLTRQRMQQARTLLLHTNCSVKQIAEEVGFENEKYFSAFFHKNEGVSPTQFRKDGK